jgi:hypothetical protein
MKPPCGARCSARPLTASSTVWHALSQIREPQQRSGEFSAGTSGEISTGIDSSSAYGPRVNPTCRPLAPTITAWTCRHHRHAGLRDFRGAPAAGAEQRTRRAGNPDPARRLHGVCSHLGSTTLTGSEFTAGQQIGVVGATGVRRGPHLFFWYAIRQSSLGGPQTVFRPAIVWCGETRGGRSVCSAAR